MATKTLDDEITETRNHLKRLVKEKRALSALTLPQKTAILIHDETCRANHIDGCSWEYEIRSGIHDWTGDTHKRYLVMAEKVLAVSDINIVKYAIMLQKMPLHEACTNIKPLWDGKKI